MTTAKVASPSLEKTFARMSLDPSAEAKVPVAVPVSRTAPAVQRAFSQADFERENAAFEKIYSAPGYIAGDIYFSSQVYDAADTKKEECAIQQKVPKAPIDQVIAIIEINEAIRILNQYFRDPIRKLGKNPSDQNIQAIYERVMKLPSFVGREKFKAPGRNDSRKRVHNLIDAFYRPELVKFGEWMVRTHQIASLKDAVPRLLNPSKTHHSLNPQGSFAEAIACEVFYQNDKKSHPEAY